MVTAETAVVLPVLVLVCCAALWAVTCAAAQIRCVGAVRDGARAAARGEPVGEVTVRVRAAAPPGAAVFVQRADTMVRSG